VTDLTNLGPTSDGRPRFVDAIWEPLPEPIGDKVRGEQVKPAPIVFNGNRGSLPEVVFHPELSKAKPTVKGRPIPSPMNQTERRYSALLDARPDVLAHWFGLVTFKLGPDCRYTPDEMLLLTSGMIEFHEVKGKYVRDDGRAKFQIAAGMFPFVFRFAAWDGKDWTIATPHPEDR
jgi:hypothetical protein